MFLDIIGLCLSFWADQLLYLFQNNMELYRESLSLEASNYRL